MNKCRETRCRIENIDDQDEIFLLEDRSRVRGVQIALLGRDFNLKAYLFSESAVPAGEGALSIFFWDHLNL